MIFLRLILVNLLRHRIRTFISIAGIAFSVAAMLTVVTVLEGAVGMFSGILSSGAEMIVFERNVSDLFFSDVPPAAKDDIAGWKMVSHADPVLFGVVSSADHPIITCFGVTAQDARIRNATWISGGGTQFGQGSNDVVLGERAADFLGASTGKSVPIGHGVFHVIGVVRTRNGFEDGGVFMPLAEAQNFFHKEGSSVLTIKLRNKEDAAAFKAAVHQHYPNLIALEDAEFSRSYSQFRILKATAWAVGGCGLALGGLGVANTMVMSVFTRIREIAILRVNGFANLQIAGIVFGESAVVATAGALSGLALGAVALYSLKTVPALHGYVDYDSSAAHAYRCGAGAAHGCGGRVVSSGVCHARQGGGGAAIRMTTERRAAEAEVIIHTSNVWKSYDQGTISVLNGVDLEARKGEAIALCGPSGCGKSTLLHLIGGLDKPTQGTVVVNGTDLAHARDVVHFMRHEVGFVFQLHNLIPDLTMEENCLLPAVAAGIKRHDALARLVRLAELTGLQGRLKHRIQKLSGGERQRTAICRALMNRPGILLADEPTGSLDERTSAAVFQLLLDLAHNEGVTLLMATHDRALASLCDRVLEMHDGRIRENC